MVVSEKGKIATIWWRMAENIRNDYLEIFLITSRAGGLEPTEGRSFGVGKSTFAIWMAYRAFAFNEGKLLFNEDGIVDLNTREQKVQLMKMIIDRYLKFTLDDVVETILQTDYLIPAIIWDDVQYSCPAYTHIPAKVRDKIEFLTRCRQRVANIICTAPSMGEIAKPLRTHINWEIIIPQRGIYEVQFLAKRRDFYNPTDDRGRLWYDATGTFDPLPEEVDIHYKIVRDKALSEFIIEPQIPNLETAEKIKQLAKQGLAKK